VTRFALALFAGILFAGCGVADTAPVAQPDAGRGPIDSRARTLPATRACDGESPPVPWIRARRTSGRIRVEYKVLARPPACKPVAIHVTANSVDKLDNIAPAEGGGGPIPLTEDEGVVELSAPPLDLPPYEARASTLTTEGRRSETTTVPIPEAGDYCRRSHSAASCTERAQAAFMRCLRGQSPRSACPDYVWNARPLIPYVPLEGVSRAALERSFTSLATRAGANPPFEAVSCPSTRQCVAVWRSYEKVFRARYAISGYGQRPGCWIAERRAILEETAPKVAHEAAIRHVISDRQSGCVSWVQ
jgi:hypothetical protein